MARADSDFIFNDWKEHQHGEVYDQTLDAAGPYVRGVADKVIAELASKIDAVNRDFAKRYGWTLGKAGGGDGPKGGPGGEQKGVAQDGFDPNEPHVGKGRQGESSGRLVGR